MSWDLVRKGGLSTSSHEARTKLRQIEKLNVKAPGERMVVKSVISSEVDYRELYVYSSNYKLWFNGDVHSLSAS